MQICGRVVLSTYVVICSRRGRHGELPSMIHPNLIPACPVGLSAGGDCIHRRNGISRGVKRAKCGVKRQNQTYTVGLSAQYN